MISIQVPATWRYSTDIASLDLLVDDPNVPVFFLARYDLTLIGALTPGPFGRSNPALGIYLQSLGNEPAEWHLYARISSTRTPADRLGSMRLIKSLGNSEFIYEASGVAPVIRGSTSLEESVDAGVPVPQDVPEAAWWMLDAAEPPKRL